MTFSLSLSLVDGKKLIFNLFWCAVLLNRSSISAHEKRPGPQVLNSKGEREMKRVEKKLCLLLSMMMTDDNDNKEKKNSQAPVDRSLMDYEAIIVDFVDCGTYTRRAQSAGARERLRWHWNCSNAPLKGGPKRQDRKVCKVWESWWRRRKNSTFFKRCGDFNSFESIYL